MESIQIIRNIFKVHPTVYLFAIISILTASYKVFIIISSLIVIHELGHFLAAKVLGLETDSIYLYPLGGISKINMPLNIPIYKDIIILIMGPIFQYISYYILLYIFNDYELITRYHIGILLFNMLPIYPLDGGKLLNIIFTCIIPYKISYRIIIYISYIFNIILLLCNDKISVNMILIYIVLIVMIRKEQLKEGVVYNKFLLERYLNNYKYKKSKIVKNVNGFYRTKNNIVYNGKKYYNEKELLEKKYHNFQ